MNQFSESTKFFTKIFFRKTESFKYKVLYPEDSKFPYKFLHLFFKSVNVNAQLKTF